MSINQSKYTTEALRKILIDEILALREGKSSLERARTVCNLAKQVFNISKVEIEAHYAKSHGLNILSSDVKLVTLKGKTLP